MTLRTRFLDYLRSIQPHPEDLTRILDTVLKQYHQERFEFTSKAERLSTKMEKLHRQKRHLLAILSEPEFADDEDAKEMLIEVKNELVEVKSEMGQSIKGEFKVEYLIQYAHNFFKHLPLLWIEASTGTKVRLQRMLFPEGLVYQSGEFSNTQLSPIFGLISESAASDVKNVTPTLPVSNLDVYGFLNLICDLEKVIGSKPLFS